MSWWVIANPAAGRRSDAVSVVRRALAERGIEAEIWASQSEEHVGELVEEGAEAGYRHFVAVGGDGTMNTVADRLLRRSWEEPPLLGILPAGSGCDFIRTFGISQRLEEAADHLLGGDEYLVDVGHLEGPWGNRYFLNAAGAGLGAAVVQAAARLPSGLGRLRYKIAIWPTLARFKQAEVAVRVDDKTYQGPAILVVFANAQFFGGGMNVAPRATLVDGVLDVQVFIGPKRLAFVLQPRLTRGTHLAHPAVRRLVGAHFELTADRPWAVETDGEYVGEGPLQGRVLPAALRIKI